MLDISNIMQLLQRTVLGIVGKVQQPTSYAMLSRRVVCGHGTMCANETGGQAVVLSGIVWGHFSHTIANGFSAILQCRQGLTLQLVPKRSARGNIFNVK